MNDRPQFESRFCVGIEQVDREHQQLVDIAGRVFDGLARQDAAAFDAARASITELLEYTATHFASEEALMESHGYPGLEAHRSLHRHLLLQARDMEMRAEFSEQYVPLELNQFLYNWLLNHILSDDMKFGAFMSSRQ